MRKNEISNVLSDIGVLLELKGENPFKIRAYQNGARALDNLDEDFDAIIAEDSLTKLPGVGAALAKKIETLYETGKLDYYDELKNSIPPGLIDMLEVPSLGAKKIKVMHDKLGIDTIDKLASACLQGDVASLPGFGEKSQQKILDGIRHRETYAKRHLWWDARAAADPILRQLRKQPGVVKADIAGSLRRGLETVGDLDFIAASSEPAPIMDWFTSMEGVVEVTAKGETKSSVRLAGGLQADLRVVPTEQFYFALHHFTGSKEHNVKMRHRALGMGLSLSEWGLRAERGSDKLLDSSIDSEESLFGKLGLSYIPPELREGLDEIDLAEKRQLPDLVCAEDLHGVFHNHTTASDGHNTLEEMALAAQALGWEYLGIADHSKASFQANGLDAERLARQIKQIRSINESGKYRTWLFAGVECDILPDGSLDLDDEILSRLDYVVVSVHSSFSQSEEEMTARVIKAIEHPLATMLGHLTGRLLLRREGYKIDSQKVIDAALANGKIVELNANPRRLDMDWRLWMSESARGLLCCINPDAHSVEGLEHFRAGVQIARKGRVAKEQLFNTFNLEKVKTYFSTSR